MKPSKVYFCDLHTHLGDGLPNKLKRLIRKAGIEQIDFANKFVAIKMNLGEPGNLSYLRPNYARVVVDVVRELGGKPFITDCNTLYVGGRKNGLDHLDSAYANGFNPFQTGCHTIIADGIKGLDEVEVPVEGGEYVKSAKIGRALMDADIVISLTHFKGHERRGLRRHHEEHRHGRRLPRRKDGPARRGQARREGVEVHRVPRSARRSARTAPSASTRFVSVELASGKKREVHVASIDHDRCVGCGRCIAVCNQDAIHPGYGAAPEVLNYKIAEYTKAVVDGRPSFHISLVIDVSPNCDCHDENDKPIVGDIGFFASFDPVALDQACIDAVQEQPALPDTEFTRMRDKLEAAGELDEDHAHDKFYITHPDTHWQSCIEHAEKIGLGTHEYELIRVK